MRIPDETLQRLKRASAERLQKAHATGDPYEIGRAQQDADLVDDLIHKNNVSKLTVVDKIHLGLLIERIIDFLQSINWSDLL